MADKKARQYAKAAAKKIENTLDFCLLVPNKLMPENDMQPEKRPALKTIFRAMKDSGWFFVDWGEDHGTHTEAWFLLKGQS